MRRSGKYEQWKEQYADDPEYITYGLLYDVTDTICRAMQEQGVTYDQLAERVGVSRAQVVRFLNTPKYTSVYTIVRFAAAIGLNVEVSIQPEERLKKGVWAVIAALEDHKDQWLFGMKAHRAAFSAFWRAIGVQSSEQHESGERSDDDDQEA